jgi:oligopeptide transport system permease protein
MAGSTPASATTDGGLWADARRRLRANRAAVAAAFVVCLLAIAALLGPLVSPYAIDQVDWTLSPLAAPPSLGNGHWFGTDSNGRDLFVRVWAGTQVSLLVALLATAVSVVIGVAWGATAGYVGGRRKLG